jgi:hypothetical protein
MATDSTETLVIAATILEQIGAETLMCIGCPRNSRTVVPATIDHDENGHLGGVMFKFTNCPKVRSGHVTITLNGNDTYHVQIFNMRNRCVYDQKGIYCDALGGRNGVIERVVG